MHCLPRILGLCGGNIILQYIWGAVHYFFIWFLSVAVAVFYWVVGIAHFGIDYLIGNETYLNKGYGKAIVKLLTDTIKQTECARQIIVQPEKENHSSNHVLLANGYIFDEQMNCYCKSLD